MSVLGRDMDLHLLPRKVDVLEFSPQLFGERGQISTLCVSMPTEHYVTTTRYSRQYLVLQIDKVSLE